MKFFIATALVATLALCSAQSQGCARGKFGVYANPTDCSKYVMCVAGAPVAVTCPFGMKFDSRIGTCSPFAKCVKAPEPEPEPEVHHPEPEPEPEVIPEPEPEPEIEEPQPVGFQCTRSAGRFQDPENCGRYFVCKDGHAAHYECPYGLNFSKKFGICLPGVKCAKKPEPEPEPEPEVIIPEPEPEPEPEIIPEPETFSCPRNGRFAEVYNCQQYHECKDGQATLKTCPFNFRFSRSIGMCLPGIRCVQEEKKPEEPKEPEVHEEPKEPEVHEEPHKEPEVHEEPAVEEPEKFSCQNRRGRFADPENCHRYYACKNGEATHYQCPKNLAFSDKVGLCVKAQCGAEVVVEEPKEPEVHEEPHKEEVHEEPHKEEVHEEPHHEEPAVEEVKKFECKKSFGLFADAHDCHKYHMCVRGRAFTVTCPTNSNYDFVNKHCVALAEARCMKQEEDVKVEEEQPVQEEKAFECPVEFGLFPASESNKFIQCANGVAHHMNCPAGTEWNQEAQACDHVSH